jgi:primosomal protein N' (replication factor Y)
MKAQPKEERLKNGQAIPRIARVLFTLPLPEPFDYEVPEGMELVKGALVAAPLTGRLLIGMVTDVREGTSNRALKPVDHVLDAPPFSAELAEFLEFAARYTVHPPGVFFRMALRSTEALGPSRDETVFAPTGAIPDRMTEARARVLAAAGEGVFTGAELARRAGVTAAVVGGLERVGALVRSARAIDPPFPNPNPDLPGERLTAGQTAAVAELCALVRRGFYAPALLDGVTGSGKTEVYLEAIAETLRQDPDAQILVMAPEIALTHAVTHRFAERFGTEPALWHSETGPANRRRVWREVAHGRARIVLGARSALFLPFQKLSLIVVDEEHDPSYKQEEGAIYHARDLAVARAKFAGAPIVLASATPSLETLQNARTGRYAHVRLPSRPGSAVLPEIELVDMRAHPPEPGRWLSPKLVTAMQETLARGEQVLLFLNRRGYAPLVLCGACGHRLTSPGTDSCLSEHRYSGRLVCHLTGFSMPKPEACPQCGAKGSLKPVGPGVERIEEEARLRFPDVRVETFSSDTAQTGQEVRARVERMARGEIDVLIGTQIVAKGHNFPGLTLVGVVDADMALRGGDPRAAERTFQILAQVAGRAGRAERKGRALIQTHAPEHEALMALAAGDRDGFVEEELEARRTLGLPPFGRMASIVLSGLDVTKLDAAAKSMAAAAPVTAGVDIYGPAEPPISVIRGRFRRRILVRADMGVDLSSYLAAWRARSPVPSSIRVAVDVEPHSFL